MIYKINIADVVESIIYITIRWVFCYLLKSQKYTKILPEIIFLHLAPHTDIATLTLLPTQSFIKTCDVVEPFQYVDWLLIILSFFSSVL